MITIPTLKVLQFGLLLLTNGKYLVLRDSSKIVLSLTFALRKLEYQEGGMLLTI